MAGVLGIHYTSDTNKTMNSRSVRDCGVLRALIVRARMSTSALMVATMLALGIATVPLKAQSNLTGSVTGQVAKGTLVTVQEVETGYLRTATSGSASIR